jgi:ATP-dependent Clp protease ATP-binding subunit ClpB
MRRRLAKKNIEVKIGKMLSMYLVSAGFDATFGARPLKRLIQSKILDELALQIIEGKIAEGDKVLIDFVDDAIKITKEYSESVDKKNSKLKKSKK